MIYGLTPHGLGLRLEVPESEAARLRDGFLALFPDLRRGLEEAPVWGAVRGYASTAGGLRRYRGRAGSPTAWERNWMTNHPVQGSAADVFKLAGNRLDRVYRRYGARLVVPVHDAFVFEAPLGVLGEVAGLTARVMAEAVEEFFPCLRPKVEVNVSDPSCWNKDGHSDSLDRWAADPTYTF
jgi:DNA polymerase-1